MAEILLKFEGLLYRPDGSKIGSVRAVFDDDYGPCVKWVCGTEKETVERVEVVGPDGEGLGGQTLKKKFKKDDMLVVPLGMWGLSK